MQEPPEEELSLRGRLALAIGRATEAAARTVAPAMPWMFLCLRRALIPTLCWVIVVVLFFIVPQTREVLHGLSEPPLKSIFDLTEETSGLVNGWSLSSYIATSIVLALAIWYTARLLVTVEAADATPPALSGALHNTQLERATTWLPRLLGVSALAASTGAFLYANLTPQLSRSTALLLAFAAIVGPLLVVFAGAVGGRWSRALRNVAIVAGTGLFLAAAVFLWLDNEKWRVALWSLSSATLPASLLGFLVQRHQILVWLQMPTDGIANADRRFGEVVVTLLSMFGVGVLAMLLLAFVPTSVARAFGSAASVLLFLSSVALLLTTAQLIVRRIAHDVPGLTSAALLLAIVLVASFGRESIGTETLAAVPALAARPTQAALSASAAASQPLRRAYVNAYGGGLRAAVFTAQALAQADDATCGEFGKQVAAFSGVSGGSLGLAVYLAARQEFVARSNWAGCQSSDTTATPLTDLVTKALVQDHLSSAIARMLAVDAPHIPGSPVRGQALLESWNSALVAALDEGTPATSKAAGLALRLGALDGGLLPPARVYFNSTDADSGRIVWFSNSDGGSGGDHVGNAAPVADMSIGQAVLHSARFPIISPAGAFSSPSASAPLRLVDGGYADNSGAITLRRALLDDRQAGREAAKPLLIDIDGNPPDESRCEAKSGGHPAVATALEALLKARSAHATLAVEQFSNEIAAKPLLIRLDLEEALGVGLNAGVDTPRCDKVRRAQQAPLGWYVSYGAAKSVGESARLGASRIVGAVGSSTVRALPAIRQEK